jgi:hypothetical protein
VVVAPADDARPAGRAQSGRVHVLRALEALRRPRRASHHRPAAVLRHQGGRARDRRARPLNGHTTEGEPR